MPQGWIYLFIIIFLFNSIIVSVFVSYCELFSVDILEWLTPGHVLRLIHVGLLLFYVLATSKVIPWWVTTCDSAHSWLHYSAASLGHQACQHHYLLCHSVIFSWHWANQSLSYPNNAERQARKWKVSVLKSLIWLDSQGPDSNLWGSDSQIFQDGKWTLYSFGHISGLRPWWCN